MSSGLIGTAFSLVALAVVGRFGRHEALAAAALVPSVLVGYGASRLFAPVLDRGWTRPAVLVVAAASAVVALQRGLT